MYELKILISLRYLTNTMEGTSFITAEQETTNSSTQVVDFTFDSCESNNRDSRDSTD